MGNQQNNFSNKFQELAPYHIGPLHQHQSITELKSKHHSESFLLKTINSHNSDKSNELKHQIALKMKAHPVPITQLKHVFAEQRDQFCSSTVTINLIFQVYPKTLKQDIAERSQKNLKYSEVQLLKLAHNLILALNFFKQIKQTHQKICSSNIYIKDSQFILADPLISFQTFVCSSPEKLQVLKNMEIFFDSFTSDLYSVGMVILEAYHLESMETMYNEKEINKSVLRQKVKEIQYSKVQQIVKDFTGPPRLRTQVISELVLQIAKKSKKQIETKDTQKYLVKQSKENFKNQMKKQIKETKQEVRNVIQINSGKRAMKSVERQIRIVPEVKPNITSVCSTSNLKSSLKKQTSIDVKNSATVFPQSPLLYFQKSPKPLDVKTIPNKTIGHHHVRSNSNLLTIPSNQLKPSTASTYLNRNSSTDNLLQSSSMASYQHKDHLASIIIKDSHVLSSPNRNLLKDKNGILNTSVSTHSLHSVDRQNHYNSYSSSKYNNSYSKINNNSFQSSYAKQFLQSIQYPSIILRESQISSRSKKQILSPLEDRKNNYSPKLQQKPEIKVIVNRYDPRQDMLDSLLYSKSDEKDKVQNSVSASMLNYQKKSSKKQERNHTFINLESQLMVSNDSKNSIQNVDEDESNLLDSKSKPWLDTLTEQNGYFYKGQYKNKLRHGDGKLYGSNGTLIYDGEWKQNYIHGYGKIINQYPIQESTDYKFMDLNKNNWVSYQGNFSKNEKHGFGKIVFSKGEIFEGQFLENMVSGFGQFFVSNQEILDGIWDKGRLVKLI